MAQGRLPDWKAILDTNRPLWDESVRKSENGPSVLVATNVGGHGAVVALESLLAVALTLRGAKVRFALCDAAIPACLLVHYARIGGGMPLVDYRLDAIACPSCLSRGRQLYESTGLPITYLGQHLPDETRRRIRHLAHTLDIEALPDYREDGIAVGEHALAGTLRFLSRGQVPDDEEGHGVFRRYFEAALLTRHAIEGLLDRHPAEVAVFHHGIYVPQGVVGSVARARGVRVANWQVAYRKKCFIFSHGETYHHTLINEPAGNWEDVAWTPAIEKTTMDYLKSRWYGTEDWIWFHDQPQHDAAAIEKELGVSFEKPTITLLTNVFWDAQLHYRANAFKDMLDWLFQSIAYFGRRPELQAVIRVHPAEVRGAIPSRQPVTEEIRARYPELPPNVFIVPPESQISTYVLCLKSDAAVIYGTKTGVELTAMGIPVIVAGEAWIRNKGLTHDADSPSSYERILDQLPFGRRMDPETVSRARKYAFHFFFRRFVPLGFLEPAEGGIPYEPRLRSLDDLLPGRDKGLDVLCDGFLKGTEFIYPAEEFIR